jgi:hypothetical protein
MKQPPKVVFCTFADSRMKRSLGRIQAQAEAIEIFDSIHVMDESHLDSVFRERFKDQLRPNVRGYGYWVWKPQIILQAFRNMEEGDLLLYCDTGCWINPKGKQRLLEYFEMTDRFGALAFQVKNTFGDPHLDRFSLPERSWTKGDLFDHFSMRDNPDITDSQQIGAGIVLMKKCQRAEELLRQWMGVYEHDFSLADDSPSRSPNLDGFIEHRHDQSIFGILCKLHDVKTLSAFEYCYPSSTANTKPDWNKLEHYPIWAKRDKDLGLIGLAKHKLNRLMSRLRG